MKQTVVDTSIHSGMMDVLGRLSARKPVALPELLAFLPPDALSDSDKAEALAASLEIDYAAGTFAICLPGDNDIDFKLGGGDLHLHSIQGSETQEAGAPDGYTFNFPDGSDSPRGRFAFWGVRLKSISLDQAKPGSVARIGQFA
jgi:hypothetical protein